MACPPAKSAKELSTSNNSWPRAVLDELGVLRAATVEAALALDHGSRGGPALPTRRSSKRLCSLETAVPALWRVPLLHASQ
ncbi:hypothetical protein FOA52_006248 [Chlamydomonas sp. UWO 241]|nr:hypothetical protein FOA52_006248 [Chlamydomonas sp. UWO 241]